MKSKMLIQFFEKKILQENTQYFSKIIEKVKASNSQDEALFCAYSEISEKYHGNRFKTLTKFPDLFIIETKKLEKMSGFLHCTNLNFILKYVLIKSNFFQEKDFSYKWTLIWGISPHQYLVVKNRTIDIWAKNYGIKYGDYARFFSLVLKNNPLFCNLYFFMIT